MMARFTGQDRLTDIVSAAMPSLLPAAELKRWKRIDHAIDDSGYVDPSAVQLLGSILATAVLDDTQVNSTSTTVYTTCVETTITLGEGTWLLIAQAQSRGGHSGGTNIDYRLNIDGTEYNEITRSAPATSAAPFFTNAVVSGLDGGREVAILAEFKCDTASTATINDSTLQIIALRTA